MVSSTTQALAPLALSQKRRSLLKNSPGTFPEMPQDLRTVDFTAKTWSFLGRKVPVDPYVDWTDAFFNRLGRF